MLKKAPIPVFFLVTLGLLICYWWVSKPAAPIENWHQWQSLFNAQAQGELNLAELSAMVTPTEQTADRFAGVWQEDWQVRAALVNEKITELNLIPTHKVSEQRMSASVGKPRLRLDLEQGYAWVYPQQGLTLYFQEGNLRLLEALPVKP